MSLSCVSGKSQTRWNLLVARTNMEQFSTKWWEHPMSAEGCEWGPGLYLEKCNRGEQRERNKDDRRLHNNCAACGFAVTWQDSHDALYGDLWVILQKFAM